MARIVNWRSPLWLSVAGALLAALVLALAVRRNTVDLDLELVDEYAGGVEEPSEQPPE